MKKLIEDQKKREKHLIQHQEKELDDFEDKWNNETYLRRFEKVTPQLLEKQAVEQKLLFQKKFEEAEQCKIEIEKMEQIESEEAQNRAIREMKSQQVRIDLRQKSEISAFQSSCETERLLLQRKHQVKIDEILAKKEKIEKELLLKKSQKHSSPAFVSTERINIMTPRTAQRYNTIKQTHRAPKITVKPMGKISKKTSIKHSK